MSETAITCLMSLSIIAAAIAVSLAASMYRCNNQWADSGFQVRYKMFAGCQIKKDDKWFPASALRIDK